MYGKVRPTFHSFSQYKPKNYIFYRNILKLNCLALYLEDTRYIL